MLLSIIGIKVNYLYKILSFITIFGLIVGILNVNQDYKHRYYDQIKKLYEKDGLISYYKNSQYGAHHYTAVKVFYEFPIFGVGIKNFRYESSKPKYEDLKFENTNARQATHPHQIHLEFLSETGIVGYLSFMIFILLSLIISLRNYLQNKNIFQLSGILFVLSSLLPVLPSGSFLSTFNSGILAKLRINDWIL